MKMFKNIWQLLFGNKEWIFSGIGVVVLTFMFNFFLKPDNNPTPVARESLEGSEDTKKTVGDNVVGNENITGNSNIVGNDNIKGNSNIVGNNNTVNVNPQPTKKNNSIELFDLLKMFLIPSNSSAQHWFSDFYWHLGSNLR
jgi:hypothetical protein